MGSNKRTPKIKLCFFFPWAKGKTSVVMASENEEEIGGVYEQLQDIQNHIQQLYNIQYHATKHIEKSLQKMLSPIFASLRIIKKHLKIPNKKKRKIEDQAPITPPVLQKLNDDKKKKHNLTSQNILLKKR